jgi:hypothetical protein
LGAKAEEGRKQLNTNGAKSPKVKRLIMPVKSKRFRAFKAKGKTLSPKLKEVGAIIENR